MQRNDQDKSEDMTELSVEELEAKIFKHEIEIFNLERLKVEIMRIFDDAEQQLNENIKPKPKDPHTFFRQGRYQPPSEQGQYFSSEEKSNRNYCRKK